MASTSDEISTVAVDIEKLENSMMTRVKNMQKEMDDPGKELRFFDMETERGYKISRVRDSVRNECVHDYEPQIISIGPIHRDKEALKQMEVLKWEYLRDLICRNPKKNTLENYMKAIHSVEEEARNLYSESVKLDDDFVEMMVLDGCFLIEFLFKAYNGFTWMELNEFKMSRRYLALLRRDLLLLENQIPLLILGVLFNSTDIPKDYWKNIRKLHKDVSQKIPGDRTPTLADLIVHFVILDIFADYVISDHFLDRLISERFMSRLTGFFRKCRGEVYQLPHVYREFLDPSHYHTSRYMLAKRMRRIWRLVAAPFLLLLSCLLTCKIPTNFWGYGRAYLRGRGLRAPTGQIPSATQLCNYGVNFKKKRLADGAEFLSVDATFDKEEGILEIPIFSLQEARISTFRNLIAFERMYCKNGMYITSHALLMACLIRTAEDVAILRDSGIIESMLKKDIEVVEMFAQFLRGYYLDDERLNNQELFKDVLKYCSEVHHKWRADFKRTYFGNPWTVASLIAAILILLLTFAQTFYTIYAYYQPRPT